MEVREDVIELDELCGGGQAVRLLGGVFCCSTIEFVGSFKRARLLAALRCDIDIEDDL